MPKYLALAPATPTAPTHPSYGCVGCAAHTAAPRSGNGKWATCRTGIRDAQRRESDRPPAGAGRSVGGRWIFTLSPLFTVIHKEKKKQKEKGPADDGLLQHLNNHKRRQGSTFHDDAPSRDFRLILRLENAESRFRLHPFFPLPLQEVPAHRAGTCPDTRRVSGPRDCSRIQQVGGLGTALHRFGADEERAAPGWARRAPRPPQKKNGDTMRARHIQFAQLQTMKMLVIP